MLANPALTPPSHVPDIPVPTARVTGVATPVAIARGLACPACGSRRLAVAYTRPGRDGTVRRKRRCRECGVRFETREAIEEC